MGYEPSVLTENRRMKYFCTVLIALFLASSLLYGQAEPPLSGVFYLEIRQTVQPEEFPRQQLRIYRMQGEALTIVIEGFDDPEAEVSVNQVLSKTCYNEIVQEAERNRLMEVGTACVAYTPVARPTLKTELKIQYKGEDQSLLFLRQAICACTAAGTGKAQQLHPEPGSSIDYAPAHSTTRLVRLDRFFAGISTPEACSLIAIRLHSQAFVLNSRNKLPIPKDRFKALDLKVLLYGLRRFPADGHHEVATPCPK